MSQLQQVFRTEDGVFHNTKEDALLHMRKPHIRAALMGLTKANQELSDWLLEQMDALQDAFDVGTVRRVTKVERNKLSRALDAAAALQEPKLAFLVEHAEAILKSFKWPAATRLQGEERDAAIASSLLALCDNNEELAGWIAENRDQILNAFEQGKIKREVSPKAKEALAAYQARKAAEKAAAEQAAAEQ